MNVTVTTAEHNSTYGNITVSYIDALAGTTNMNIFINQTNSTGPNLDEITEASYIFIGATSNWNYTWTVPADGESYFVHVNATHTTFDTIKRSFSVTFPKSAITIGLPSEWNLYIAAFFILFFGLLFGATTSPTAGCIICCFVGWVFWGIGWLDDLGLNAPIALGFATFVSVMSVVMVGSKKERFV